MLWVLGREGRGAGRSPEQIDHSTRRLVATPEIHGRPVSLTRGVVSAYSVKYK